MKTSIDNLPIFELLPQAAVSELKQRHQTAFAERNPDEALRLAKDLMRLCKAFEGKKSVRTAWARASCQIGVPQDARIARTRAAIFNMICSAADIFDHPSLTQLEANCRMVGYGTQQDLGAARFSFMLAGERGIAGIGDVLKKFDRYAAQIESRQALYLQKRTVSIQPGVKQ